MKISITLFIAFFFFQINIFATNESTFTDIYCSECGDSLGGILKLPNDTIRDTVYVSNIDGFLSQYGCNLGTFAKKYGSMKRMVDSINNLSEERLYYNFFLPKDKNRKLSTRYIVKRFYINKRVLVQENEVATSDFVDWAGKSLLRTEILLTCNGSDHTNLFLKDPVAISKVISGIFTTMQGYESNDSLKIEGINLFFPDFTFNEKRAMVQFVKSFRIILDASKSYRTRLNVTFINSKGIQNIEKGFLYALMQEASEVICLNNNMIDSCYISGSSLAYGSKLEKWKMENLNLTDQIFSHYYIARYYTDTLDIVNTELTSFTENDIKCYLHADYSENTWEIYMLLLLLTLFVMIVVVILYYTCFPVSTFVNKHIEFVVLVSLMMLLEILALGITTFQHMCKDDDFSALQKQPLLLFSLPLVIVLIIPLFKGISKKRRMP